MISVAVRNTLGIVAWALMASMYSSNTLPCVPSPVQAEILLESYLQDVDEILTKYDLTLQHIQATENLITMRLDMARNKLLTTGKDNIAL